MFAPAVWAAIAAGSALAGAGVSAYGMIQQGKAQRRESEYQAQVDENNAITTGYAAIQEQRNAQIEADQLRGVRDRALGSQRAAAAASGLTISGSVIDVMNDSAIEAEKEIQMSIYRGNIAAQNRRGEADNLRQRAKLTRMSGRNAQRTSFYQAGGTLLSGAASAGAGYASFKKG
jgi:hypothetical protein